jgi:hypothetical protein
LWLEITNSDLSGGVAFLNLHAATNVWGATNEIYGIFSTTNLLSTAWPVETEVWQATNYSVVPFTVPTQNRTNLFLRAQDWTGMLDGFGVPVWWDWLYLGSTSLASTNLDFSGNGTTFGQDFTNNVVPVVYNYTGITATNSIFNFSPVPVTLAVTGWPYYVAVLVDTNDFSGAVWNQFNSPEIAVPLGTAGWHEVWIGLRGHADAAAVWQWTRLKLDFTPPQLVITSPTNSNVTAPVLQLQGYSTTALGGLTYDLSNALTSVTGQTALITGEFYDTNTAEYTTNYFQAYDVPLTNGLNVITLHAIDLAGNMATLTTNIVCAATNPPNATLVWPQDGMQISGASFTLHGQVDDPTSLVTLTGQDADGNPIQLTGRTGRDGNFWVENVPLTTAEDDLTLAVSNAVGGCTFNFSVYESTVGLTINAVQAGDTTAYGTIDTPGYILTVNGATASQDGNGNWTATITPIGIGGGLVTVMAVTNTDNDSVGAAGLASGLHPRPNNEQTTPPVYTQATVEPPQGVFVSKYHESDQTDYNLWYFLDPQGDIGWYVETWYDNQDWQDGQGGNSSSFGYEDMITWFPFLDTVEWPTNSWPQAMLAGAETNINWNNDPDYVHPPGTTNNVATGAPVLPQEHCDIYKTVNVDGSTERRTADTEIKLATGGLLGSTDYNLWVITPNVTDAETGQPIPFDQISVGFLGQLGTDGKLNLVLADNGTNTITPKVVGHNHYNFSVAAQEYKLHIIANTIVLSNNVVATGANFCVGQEVSFALGGLPLDGSVLATNFIWTLSGKYFNAHTNAVSGVPSGVCSPVPYVDKNLLASNNTTAWWVSGGSSANTNPNIPTIYLAFISWNLQFTNGNATDAGLTVGQFNMYRPQATISASTTSVAVQFSDGHLKLIFADSTNNYGITFSNTVTTPDEFPGDVAWIQVDLATAYSAIDSNSNIHTEFELGDSPYLDTETPYNAFSGTNPIDGPWIALDGVLANYQTVNAEDNFQMTMLFRPSPSGNNHWVPLSAVNWFWRGVATNGPNGWGLKSGTNSIDPKGFDSETYPFWKSNVTNSVWVPSL